MRLDGLRQRVARFLLITMVLWIIPLGLPIGASAAPPPTIPPDLTTGFVYSSIIPLVSQPVQAVYATETGQYATMNASGNVSLYTEENGQLVPTQTYLESDSQNFGPDLVNDPETGSLYWINANTNDIESLSLSSSDPQLSILFHDPNLPQYLSLGPNGQHLYVVDQGTSGSGDIGQLSLTDPSAGLSTLALASPADAPAAVYQSNAGPVAFIPSTVPNGVGGGGSIMRVSFAGSPHSLSTLSDPSLPSGLVVSSTGQLVVAQTDANTISFLDSPASSSPTWLSPSNAPAAISNEPGQIQVGSNNDISVLGNNTANNPVWMVYDASTGVWTEPPLGGANGPLLASSGVVVSPTTANNQVAVLSGSNTTNLFTLSNTLSTPVSSDSDQIATSPQGNLWVADQTGAAEIDPNTDSVAASVSVSDQLSGGITVNATNQPILTTSSPAGIYSTGTSSFTQTTDGSTPIAVAVSGNGDIASLNSSTSGIELWQPTSSSTTPLSFRASGIVETAEGPAVAGAGALELVQSGDTLTNSAFSGPLAVSSDGSLVFATSTLSSGLEVTNLNAGVELGSIALHAPTMSANQTLGTLTGISVSPSGNRLYALTGNAVVVYQGPQLTLSAATLTPDAASTDLVTATLVNGEEQPVSGQSVQLSTGTSAITNSEGTVSFPVAITAVGPLALSASTADADAKITLQAQPAPVIIPPPSSGTPPPASTPPSGPGGSSPPSGGTSPNSNPSAPPLPAPSTLTAPVPTPTTPPSPAKSPPSRSNARPVPWQIRLGRPRQGPKLSLRLNPTAVIAKPPGAMLQTFDVSVSSRRLYPGDYRIEIIAPPNFNGRYGLWYFSRPAWRWFPVLPVATTYRTYIARIPYLTTMAITRRPVPLNLSVINRTWLGLSTVVADMSHPDGFANATLASPSVLSERASTQAGSSRSPLFIERARGIRPNLTLAIALARMGSIRVNLLGMVAMRNRRVGAMMTLLRTRGFQVRRMALRNSSRAPIVNGRSPNPRGSAPQLLFGGTRWSPERLAWLRQLNLQLTTPNTLDPGREALMHQIDDIRRIGVANPVPLAVAYHSLIIHSSDHGIVEGLDPDTSAIVPLAQELASMDHALVLVSTTTQQAWHAFALGFLPSFMVTVRR